MPATALHRIKQFFIASLNTRLAQQLYALRLLQPTHRILLHIGRWITTRALRPGATGKQDTAAAGLPIDDIKPFADPWLIRQRIARLPIKQILKLSEHNLL